MGPACWEAKSLVDEPELEVSASRDVVLSAKHEVVLAVEPERAVEAHPVACIRVVCVVGEQPNFPSRVPHASRHGSHHSAGIP